MYTYVKYRTQTIVIIVIMLVTEMEGQSHPGRATKGPAIFF